MEKLVPEYILVVFKVVIDEETTPVRLDLGLYISG